MLPTNYKLWIKENWYSFFTATLKNISQVMLIENAISGLIILLAITIFSYDLGAVALLSSLISIIVGKIGGVEDKIISQGLFGYNSVLTGMALTIFLTGPYNWIIALISAALAAVLTAAMMHIMKRTEIPVLTFPFIILTWLMLLASYRLKVFHLTSNLRPQDLSHWKLEISGKIDWGEGVFNGFAQIFFIHGFLSGILIIIAVCLAGWKLGLYAIVGNACALLISYTLGGEHNLIYLGLYGYNAILTMLAVSVVFKTVPNRFTLFTGIVAVCLTVVFTGSIDTWLLPYGLPTLTMPFVLSTWIFLGARKILPNL
ncbi:urea transporter [Bacillus sp. FSL K6-0268]|uniref:urea transporter n=1 Tax=Bacillus sp. FSL K6-0268 TaxID=2921449 RepID=UPI0030FA2B5D